ncbi:MAG: response regulator transcription factor [Gemmatimonadales bacterium]
MTRQSPTPTVFVVDDDPSVCRSLDMLLRSFGHPAETYGSADAFLRAYRPERPGCLVLDLRMPGMSGLDLQRELGSRGAPLPIVFITAHGDVPAAVQALQGGAVDFLQKPFRDQDLIDKVERALEQNAKARRERAARREITDRIRSLTSREMQVMEFVVKGLTNRAIAEGLELSERTVEIHRARMMRKMVARSLPDLVQMVTRVRTGPAAHAPD